MTSKALVVGASGQIGTQLVALLGRGHCLTTTSGSSPGKDMTLDLSAANCYAMAQRLLDRTPLSAIYCVGGMTNVEACEDAPELAHNINCRGPEALVPIAREREIPFVYFSTEYVFDGEGGPYTETSPTNAVSAYGKSKLDGEQAVLAAWHRTLVVRTTVVYGEDEAAKNFAYSVIRVLKEGRQMRVPADQISTPSYNKDVARATVSLVDQGLTGIFHVCGPQLMDRLTFAHAVANHMGLDSSLLIGVPTSELGQKAARPLSAGLLIGKLQAALPTLRMRPLSEGLQDCKLSLQAFQNSLGQ